MPECSVDAVKRVVGDSLAVSEALLGKGIRLHVERPMSLRDLPRELLEALVDCEVVEIVEPEGRVVYFTRDWVRRALELVREEGNSG